MTIATLFFITNIISCIASTSPPTPSPAELAEGKANMQIKKPPILIQWLKQI